MCFCRNIRGRAATVMILWKIQRRDKRTEADYGRGARVRMPVPSRILPGASFSSPAAVRGELAGEQPVCRSVETGYAFGWVDDDWVCASSLSLSRSSCLPASSDPLQLRRRAGIGRDPVSDIRAAVSEHITAEQRGSGRQISAVQLHMDASRLTLNLRHDHIMFPLKTLHPTQR
ncbi:hypothetical protein GOODEAATRI_029625 [Goodea atripinnis]|uniref:Uncharacterized protein n=1 Tax=Goodea atripinnis TaxID=208336 RepID=A0ABV0NP66_9TELE